MWKVGDENDRKKIQVPKKKLLKYDEGTTRKRMYKTHLN